jgi:hypothetical protein
MTSKKASFTLANYEIANVNVALLVLIYIYVRTILFVKITNQFADSNITPSLYLGILFQIYDSKCLKLNSKVNSKSKVNFIKLHYVSKVC